MNREFDSAIPFLQRAVELQPEFTTARVNLGEGYILKGMYSEAQAVFQEFAKTDQEIFLREQIYLNAAAGRTNEARRLLPELSRLKVKKTVAPYDYVVMYAALGDKDSAFYWLKKVELSKLTRALIKIDPQLDPLRQDGRFVPYLKQSL